MPATVHRTVADGMTILGLPRKIGNANTRESGEILALFPFCKQAQLPVEKMFYLCYDVLRRSEKNDKGNIDNAGNSL